MNLAARTLRPGVAHHPEVVFKPQPEDAVVGKAGDFFPQRARFVVGPQLHRGIAAKHRDHQPLGVQRQLFGQKLPRQLDRPRFEVVAKREVAEHLEEGVVTGGAPDVV